MTSCTIIYIIIVILLLLVIHYLFPIIQVVGDSMHPTYHDGEYILGTRIYRKSKLKIGDVIIYKSPKESRIVIKRIDDIKRRKGIRYFYCLGDNKDHSYDSRYYGFVSSRRLKCKVINQRRKKNVCNQERWNS